MTLEPDVEVSGVIFFPLKGTIGESGTNKGIDEAIEVECSSSIKSKSACCEDVEGPG